MIYFESASLGLSQMPIFELLSAENYVVCRAITNGKCFQKLQSCSIIHRDTFDCLTESKLRFSGSFFLKLKKDIPKQFMQGNS